MSAVDYASKAQEKEIAERIRKVIAARSGRVSLSRLKLCLPTLHGWLIVKVVGLMLQRKELALQDEFGNAATLRAAPNYWLKLVGYRDVSSEFEFQDLVDEFARGNLS